MADIAYCASDCDNINCKRNKANIKDPNELHMWCRPEDVHDCPRYESDWYWMDAFEVPLHFFKMWVDCRKSRKKARWKRKFERMKKRRRNKK